MVGLHHANEDAGHPISIALRWLCVLPIYELQADA